MEEKGLSEQLAELKRKNKEEGEAEIKAILEKRKLVLMPVVVITPRGNDFRIEVQSVE